MAKESFFETGKIARQADGVNYCYTCGETVVMATAVGAKKACGRSRLFSVVCELPRKNIMLLVKHQVSYFKREARPTEAETLNFKID